MTEDIPSPELVLDLLAAFRRSKTMFACVSMSVFDHLAKGPQAVDDLAVVLGANPAALERLLNAAVGLQLLTRTGSEYANTPAASTYLCQNSARRMTGYINYSNDVMWKLWGHLEDAVRDGTHRWQQGFGWDGPIFSHFFRTEEAAREFLMGMHGFGVISSPAVVRAFDLSRFKQLVDLGGATGHLCIAACECYPQLEATVFELPSAIPLAREMVSQSSAAPRLSVQTGDFFANPLPTADLYSLGRILHDWTLEKCQTLLKKIYAALPSGGALLIAEKLLSPTKDGPVWAQMQDLNMLIVTEGCERTLTEYETLLRGIGFARVTGVVTNTPIDAIFAEKL